jgi:hypothetical protein
MLPLVTAGANVSLQLILILDLPGPALVRTVACGRAGHSGHSGHGSRPRQAEFEATESDSTTSR